MQVWSRWVTAGSLWPCQKAQKEEAPSKHLHLAVRVSGSSWPTVCTRSATGRLLIQQYGCEHGFMLCQAHVCLSALQRAAQQSLYLGVQDPCC